MAFATAKAVYLLWRKELFTNRIFGWWIRDVGLPIDRENPGAEAIKYPNMPENITVLLIMFSSGRPTVKGASLPKWLRSVSQWLILVQETWKGWQRRTHRYERTSHRYFDIKRWMTASGVVARQNSRGVWTLDAVYKDQHPTKPFILIRLLQNFDSLIQSWGIRPLLFSYQCFVWIQTNIGNGKKTGEFFPSFFIFTNNKLQEASRRDEKT